MDGELVVLPGTRLGLVDELLEPFLAGMRELVDDARPPAPEPPVACGTSAIHSRVSSSRSAG